MSATKRSPATRTDPHEISLARRRLRRHRNSIRNSLIEHIGGDPSPVQRALIDRIATLRYHIARMDEKILEDGELSEANSARYLAWSAAYSRLLLKLGIRGAPQRQLSPIEILQRQPSTASAPR